MCVCVCEQDTLTQQLKMLFSYSISYLNLFVLFGCKGVHGNIDNIVVINGYIEKDIYLLN